MYAVLIHFQCMSHTVIMVIHYLSPKAGHLMCMDCYNKMPRPLTCPTCRTKMPGSPIIARAAEQVRL